MQMSDPFLCPAQLSVRIADSCVRRMSELKSTGKHSAKICPHRKGKQ